MLKNPINTRLYELEMKQKELAQKIGVPHSTLSAWITEKKNPPQEARRAIAKALKCPQKNLFKL